MQFFSKKFIKRPLAVLLIICFLLPLAPHYQKAEAYSLYDLRKDVEEGIAKIIPEISFAQKPYHPKTEVEDHFDWSLLKSNPFDQFSFRSGAGKMVLGAVTKPFLLRLPWVSKVVELQYTVVLKALDIELPNLDPLDEKIAQKRVEPGIFELCQAKIPAKEKSEEDSVNRFCQEYCQKEADKESRLKCERQCPAEQRRRIQQACGALRRIQKSAARQAQLAKQVYLDTDPLSTCSFLRNCRTSCQLSLGGFEVRFSILEIVLNVLLLLIGGEAEAARMIEIAQEMKDLVVVLERAKEAYDAVMSFIDSLYGLLSNSVRIVRGVVNVMGVIMNNALASPLDWQTWKEFGENFGKFTVEKANALSRLDEAGAKLSDIAEMVEEESGIGSDKHWKKLFEIKEDYLNKFIYFDQMGGNYSYQQAAAITDFKDKPLWEIEKAIKEIEAFIKEKNGNNKTDRDETDRTNVHNSWLSDGHREEVEEKLEDIQEAIYNIRGIKPSSGNNWEVINNPLEYRLAAKGIFGIKEVWHTPKEKLNFLPTRFGYLGAFVLKLEKTKLKSIDIAKELDEIIDIIGNSNEPGSLMERTTTYFDPEDYQPDDYNCASQDETCYNDCMDGCIEKAPQPKPWLNCRYGCEDEYEDCLQDCMGDGSDCDCDDLCERCGSFYCFPDPGSDCASCDRDCSYCINTDDKDDCVGWCESVYDCNGNGGDCEGGCEDEYDECVDDDGKDDGKDDDCASCCSQKCQGTSGCTEQECKGCWQDRQDVVKKFQGQFQTMLERIKDEALKVKNQYVGQWGGGKCPNFSGTCRFNYEAFFVQGQDNDLFLNDLYCFEKTFYQKQDYCFFDEVRMWLDIFEKLTEIDRQLFIAKENVLSVEPLLDVPPGRDMMDHMDFSDIFKSPFDYINEWVAAIHRASVRAVEIIEELETGDFEGKTYRSYLGQEAIEELKLLREDFIGEGKQAGFSGLDRVLYDVGKEQEEAVPQQADVFKGVLEESEHLDKISIAPEEIFSAYGFDTPQWYNDFIRLITQLRKTQYGLRDILFTKIEVQRLVQYFFNTKTKLEDPKLTSPHSLEMRAQLLAPIVQQLLAVILRLQGQLISTEDMLAEIRQELIGKLPADLVNPFASIDLTVPVDLPADYCQNKCLAVCGVSSGQCYELCCDKCAEMNVGLVAFGAAKRIQNIDWQNLFSLIKQALSHSAIDVLQFDLNNGPQITDKIIAIADNIIEYQQSIENISYADIATALTEMEPEAEKRISRFVDLVDLVQKGITMQTILPSVMIGAKQGSFLDTCNKVEEYVKKIMQVLGVIIGIKSAYYDIYKTSGHISPDLEDVGDSWKTVRESAKDLRVLLISEQEESLREYEQKGFGISAKWEGVTCESAAARGVNRTTGPQGGQVCPNIDRLTRQINSHFSEMREALRDIQIIRRIPQSIDLDLFKRGEKVVPFTEQGGSVLGLKWGDLDVDFIDIYKVTEPNDLYYVFHQAEDIVDRARDLWGLNTAVDFANKECTCGWSYCSIPICISELPLTPQALTNAYCWIIYILRGWFWRKARELETFLEEGNVTPELREQFKREVLSDFGVPDLGDIRRGISP